MLLEECSPPSGTTLNNFDSDINEGANFLQAVKTQLKHASKMSLAEREQLFHHCLITKASGASSDNLKEIL